MKRIAIIPVKTRSRRLPGKNTRIFRGKPMFVHTVNSAILSGLFDRVVVSSSDADVLAIAKAAGADEHIRDRQQETDAARLVDVCISVLADESKAGRSYDLMVLLLATAPMRGAEDIDSVVREAEKSDHGGAIAVTTYSHPAHQALKILDEGKAEPMWPDLVAMREEELPDLRVDNGSTYALHVGTFLEEKTMYVSELRAYEMPRHRSVDLDDEEDFDLLNYYSSRD